MSVDPSGLVFGPVASSRLGVSLGLDLLGAKICSFDCLYCEVGPTRALTRVRRPYVPARTVLGALRDFLSGPHPAFEVITLGGMGEPTLNSDLGAVIDGVRELAPGAPVAVLTNSSLLDDSGVRRELAGADLVLPSMDTLVEAEFARLNRPERSMSLADMRRGLLDFRREFSGRLCLEVLVLAGVNDSRANLELLREFCRELVPDRVDVVTMSRPGAYDAARPAPAETLERFRSVLAVPAPAAEPPGKARHFASALDKDDSLGLENVRELILRSLTRRPQTAGQLVRALGLARPDVDAGLDGLAADGLIESRDQDGRRFHFARRGASGPSIR